MSSDAESAVSAAAKHPTETKNTNASNTGAKRTTEKELKCSVCGASEPKSRKGSWIYDDDENETDRVGAYCIELAVGETTGKQQTIVIDK